MQRYGGFMRTRISLTTIPLLAIWTAGAADAPTTSNPIPEPIVKRGLAVEVKDFVRLPDTRGLRSAEQDVSPAGWARVSYVRDLPDGRRFANDSRGYLYLMDSNNQPHVYADVAATFPYGVYNRLESGFIGFVFHPEFATNGLFYTVHSEIGPGNPKTTDFIPIGYGLKDVTYHNVITEWHATNPAANTFAGTRREILREAHVVANLTHPNGRRRIQSDGETRRSGLRLALHQRQPSWIQQSFQELVEKTMGKSLPRADLHISRSRNSELFLTSRQDGMIRMLSPDDNGSNSTKR
jgi:hypothetical protein